jgi:hypothetical protein
MNKLMHEQIYELLTNSQSRAMLECERALRVGAATLCRGAITATTIVCDIAADDLDAFESLVVKIADEFDIDASIRPQPGRCSVRFSWPEPCEAIEPAAPAKSLLARLLGG